MTPILNLTQHNASKEQIEAGVIDVTPEEKEYLKKLLTFDELPTHEEISKRAKAIADIAHEYKYAIGRVMIGGAPYLMADLEHTLFDFGIKPCYAFSERVSVENKDGVKISVFKHKGFINI